MYRDIHVTLFLMPPAAHGRVSAANLHQKRSAFYPRKKGARAASLWATRANILVSGRLLMQAWITRNGTRNRKSVRRHDKRLLETIRKGLHPVFVNACPITKQTPGQLIPKRFKKIANNWNYWVYFFNHQCILWEMKKQRTFVPTL